MRHIWSFGGQDYRFDISEARCAERLERALEALREEICDGCADKYTAPSLERHCRMIEAFFDTVLGEGCGKTVCGGGESAEAHSEAYVDFILFVNSEVRRLSELTAQIENCCKCSAEAAV